jgi:hypothetical protein
MTAIVTGCAALFIFAMLFGCPDNEDWTKD